MRRDSLLDFFGDLAATHGEFLVYDDGYRSRSYTYGETARAARAFAARLQSAGIKKTDKVVFWSENRPEWIIALWGCLLNGTIAVPIDFRASRDFLERVAGIVDAKIVLIGEEVDQDLGQREGSGRRAEGVGEVWKLSEIDWKNAPGDGFTPVAVTRDDVAEIIFTSGATAEPKGVVLTHRNVLANIVPVEKEVHKYRKLARPFQPLRFLNLLPLSHMFGQAMATFVPPMVPATVIFMKGLNPHEVARQIKKRRISVLISVPKILDVLAEHAARIEPAARELPDQRLSIPARWSMVDSRLAHVITRWWRYRALHRHFGFKFWAFVVGAAPLDPQLESFWTRLGYLVVQGYGLTETAPIVTLNHPFSTSRGSVGKPISGVDVKIAEDGEILVRGDNVTTGYYGESKANAAFDDGWFHTGDIGEKDAAGRLFIRGRKKEMIVTPEGLNVFPEDVERVVDDIPGVRDSAAVGITRHGEERVHVALVLDEGIQPRDILRSANAKLQDHQRIRDAVVWPGSELPRTDGTKKLKRVEIQRRLQSGTAIADPAAYADGVEAVVARYAGGRALAPGVTIEELGLSSLERVEMMVALEESLNTTIDESSFANAATIGDLQKLANLPASDATSEPVDFPRWNRAAPIRWMRAVSQSLFLLPLARVFAWIHIEGLHHLRALDSPVIFASNHQSHMDVPVILAALPGRLRRRVAPAMAKEFFKAHFFPERFTRTQWFTNSLNYWLSAAFFNTFPLPQREAGARQTLRYAGDLIEDGFSVLIFPEGRRTDHGEMQPFKPGIGMLGAKLAVPVIPVRLVGVERVLHRSWKMAKPGRVTVKFGAPLFLQGDDYEGLAAKVEKAVVDLGG